jgi:hypothetical protein
LKKKLQITNIYISQETNYEDTQFAESKYFHEIEVTYEDSRVEKYLVIVEVYGDPCYELISEIDNSEEYNEYIQLSEEYYESLDD